MVPTPVLRIAKSALLSINRRVLDAWIPYNLTVMLLGIFVIPFLILVARSVISVFVLVAYFFLTIFDDVKFEVGEKDPEKFLKVEGLRKAVFHSFWILLLVLLGIIGSLIVRDTLRITSSTLNLFENVFYWIAPIWFGTWFCSSTFLGEDIFRSNALMKLQARARFRAALNVISDRDQRKISKGLPFFREGLQILNKLLRSRFGFVIKEPLRFYNYVRLMTISPDENVINEIEKGLEKVVGELEKKEIDPFQILRGLKEIIREPVSDKKLLIAEVETESRARKWFFANLQVITLIVEATSLIIVAFALIMGR